MEMGWMETFELLGLHLLVALLLGLVALDQVVQYTWRALRRPQAAEPKRLPPIGAQRHA